MSFNPYMSPRADMEEAPQGQCWREGKLLVMWVGSSLPHRCVKCNEPAVKPVKPRKISWHHPGWYVLLLVYIVAYAIAARLASKRQTIAPGLCARHTSKRNLFNIASIGLFCAGLFLLFYGISDLNGIAIPAGAVAVVLSIIISMTGTRIVYPSRITDDLIYLKGCGEPFLDSLGGR